MCVVYYNLCVVFVKGVLQDKGVFQGVLGYFVYCGGCKDVVGC